MQEPGSPLDNEQFNTCMDIFNVILTSSGLLAVCWVIKTYAAAAHSPVGGYHSVSSHNVTMIDSLSICPAAYTLNRGVKSMSLSTHK